MELTVSGPVVEGTFPTPSPGWITPVTFVLSVWAASLVMACCSGAACYKAWFMPRQSHMVVRESGNPIRTRRDSSRSTMRRDRARNTMTAEERGSSVGPMETPSSTPGVESAPEESRTVSPARNPRRRSLSSSETTGAGSWEDHRDSWAMPSPGGTRVRHIEERPNSRGAITRRMVQEASPGAPAERRLRQQYTRPDRVGGEGGRKKNSPKSFSLNPLGRQSLPREGRLRW